MFVATTNFLSALILSRKICMLSSGLSRARPWGAKPNRTIAIAAPIVFFTKSILIVFLLLLLFKVFQAGQNDLRGKACEGPRAEAYLFCTLTRSGPSTTKH